MEHDQKHPFQRETALQIFLEELDIPADSTGFRLLTHAVLKSAEHPERELSEIFDEIAAEEELSARRVYRSIRHVVLLAWENESLPRRMTVETFIPYAVRWLLESEEANKS